jgi:hypothetical protein
MIIKGFTITAGGRHATHLLKTDENEHVLVQEMRGFVARDLHGAFAESQAIARGTRCQQHLFSCAFSPPDSAPLSARQFLHAIDRTEQALGLDGQPRAIVFHEKDGRRHAHCVWSRIDADSMTARQLSHWKTKLGDVSRDLHREFGIEMPRGLADRKDRDPLNFSHAESQMAKRHGEDPRWLRQTVQDCWKACDNRRGFEAALSEKSLQLAQGDKRGFVVLDFNGSVHSLSRLLGLKTKDVKAKLGGEPARSLEDAKQQLSKGLDKEARAKIDQSRQRFAKHQTTLKAFGAEMTHLHRDERAKLAGAHSSQWLKATQERQARLPRGVRGLWSWITGKSAEIKKDNLAEASEQRATQEREREEQIRRQAHERHILQEKIKELRHAQAQELIRLRRELAEHIGLRRNAAPKLDAPAARLGLKLER